MRKYKYIARDQDGSLLKGVVYGQSEEESIAQLRSMKLYPIRLRVTCIGNGGMMSGSRKVSYSEMGVFCKQFSTLLQAGIAIPQALRLLGNQKTSPKVQEIINDLLRSLEQGETLYQGFNKHSKKLPEFFCSLIRVGELTNQLDSVLERLSLYYIQEEEYRKQVQRLLAYPFILIGSSVAVVIFLLLKIIPGFQGIFESFGEELPVVTYCLLATSNYLRTNFNFFLIGLPICMFFLSYLLKRQNIKKWYIRVQYKFPLIGTIKLQLVVGKLARIWHLLIANGLEVLPAIELTSETSGYLVKDFLKQISSNLKKGLTFSRSLKLTNFFPDIFTEMVTVGEESGSLPEMLERIAEMYEKESKGQIDSFLTILEPLLLMGIALIVGLIVLAVMLPMFEMIRLF